MQRPIDDLLASEEFRKDGWARVVSARWEGARINLELAIDEGEGGITRARWRIACEGVLDYLICDTNGGGLRLSNNDNPAVRQYLEPKVGLFIEARAVDPGAVIGALWLAHRRAVDDWIAFDRYLKTPLDEILAKGCSKVAEGPRFLLEEYAGVLSTHGIEATFAPKSSVGPLENGESSSGEKQLLMIHFGNSYIVAAKFTAERLDRV